MYQNYIFDLYGTLIDIHTDETSKNFLKNMQSGLDDKDIILSGSGFINYILLRKKNIERKRNF